MNKIDLTVPTRQSAKGLILIFIFSLRKFIGIFWPIILIAVFQKNYFENKLVLGVTIIAVLILLIGHTILWYFNFIFYVANGEFVLKKGYLRKKTLTIPLDRIQSVNTKQNVIQQFLNIETLEIDTAGSVAKELKIQALEKSFSIELQNLLRSQEINKQEIDSDNQVEITEVVEELILKLSPSDLMRIGISQNHLRAGLIIIAFGFQIFQQIQDLFKEKAEEYSNEFIGFMSNSNWALITFLVVFFLIISILFSLFRTVLKYFDFKLTKKEGNYRIESGLLNKRIVIIPHGKVQELIWETGPVKQVFGIYHLVFKQAVSDQNRRGEQLVDAPGCLISHLELLKKDLFGEDKLSDALKIYSNPYYFRPLWMIYGWLPVLLASPFLFGEWMFWLTVVIWLPASAFYCSLILKKRYFSMNNEQIIVSKGAISHQWTQMELHKIQAVQFRQSVFQKRRSLSSLHLMNASGTITIPYIDEMMAKQIYNYLLFHTEVSKKKWM